MSAPVEILRQLRSGRREALDQLLPLVYMELRAIAHAHLRRGQAGTTMVTTALVHEAYLKLVDQGGADWKDRAHFRALASVAMRHVLVDRARSNVAIKRGGMQERITLDEESVAAEVKADTLLELDAALEQLAFVEPRLARVVECRFYGGLTVEEIAEALGVTTRTVERDWVKARMLLRAALVHE